MGGDNKSMKFTQIPLLIPVCLVTIPKVAKLGDFCCERTHIEKEVEKMKALIKKFIFMIYFIVLTLCFAETAFAQVGYSDFREGDILYIAPYFTPEAGVSPGHVGILFKTGGKWWVRESHIKFLGTASTPFITFYRRYTDIGLTVRLLRVECEDAQAKQAADWAQSAYGSYSYPSFMPVSYSCSSFVWAAYYNGPHIDIAPPFVVLNLILPTDILASTKIQDKGPIVIALLDLIFCIDNTGSMWDDIASAKSAARDIVNEVLAEADARIALVTYRDFPFSPYGYPGDWTFRDEVDFTDDASALIAGINRMSASGGADWPESVYSALMHCINAGSLGGWRGEPVRKAIILMGDAPPHDPEPFTGYTMNNVIQAAEAADPVNIYPIAIGGDVATMAYFDGLADGTGGEVFTAADAGEVVNAIMEAIAVIKHSPFAEAGGPYSGVPGAPITLDASDSYDPDGEIVLYEWDWDIDGIYDYNSTDPVCQHTWLTEYSGIVRLRVTDNDGLTSMDTAEVRISAVIEPIVIDICPYCLPNRVYLNKNYIIYVVAFGSDCFDVSRISSSSVLFGPTGTEACPVEGPIFQDINRDGFKDVKFGFQTFDCGFSIGDSKGILTGTTTSGTFVQGTDSLLVLTGGQPPVAEAGGPYQGAVGQPISFNASGTYDPDGEIRWYCWAWGPDGKGNAYREPLCQHTWYSRYSGNVTLAVIDDEGLYGNDTAWVEVTGPERTMAIDLASHADLHVYDSHGRHMGVNYLTHTLEENIPGGHFLILDQKGNTIPYEGNGLGEGFRQIVNLPLYALGSYRIELVGTSDGPFDFSINGLQDGKVVSANTYKGDIFKDELLKAEVKVGATGENLTFDYGPLLFLSVLGVEPDELQVIAEPGTLQDVTFTVLETRGKEALHSVNMYCTDIIGRGGTINGADVSFDIQNFDVSPGGQQVVHAYIPLPIDFKGKATGSIVVESADGGTETINVSVKTPTKYNPVAKAGGPYVGVVGQPIMLDASGSYDLDGEIKWYIYCWTWDGHNGTGGADNQPIRQHTWNSEFSGQVLLIVIDYEGQYGMDTTWVEIRSP